MPRRKTVGQDNGPHPVDVHVGNRVRLQRNILRKSQEDVADMIGLTFQQVQKYEKGSNRISASRLVELSRALECPVSWFFDGLDVDRTDGFKDWTRDPQMVEVMREFATLTPNLQSALVGVLHCLVSIGGG
jgi:transcriptional regulator with XRE-family HTH domain